MNNSLSTDINGIYIYIYSMLLRIKYFKKLQNIIS